jgi:8-hydroxy-5-deazaflavin:NADPH oxidoreductase
MRIGILGTGNMADALGGQWAARGHEIMVGGRDAGRAAARATRVGAAAGTIAQAAAWGEVLLLAVPHDAVGSVLSAAGALSGKVIVDCVNPVVPGRFTLATSGRSAAQEVADRAPEAHVVKAFNLCHVNVWRMTPPPVAVPLCGDDTDAVARVASLVEDIGCQPVNAGGLDRAGLLEATAAFVIGLWVGGGDAKAVVPPLEFAFGRQ